MPNYANITNSTQTNKDGGFKSKLYFIENSNVTTWQRPTGAGTTLGDKTLISVAHTFAASQGAWQWETKIGSVILTAETQGDEGAKVPIYTVKAKVLGLNAATLDQMVNMLNDQKTIWLKDSDCTVADAYYQLGDDCNPVTVSWTFDGKDSLPTSTGQKEFEVTFVTKKLFFYAAALDTTF